MTSFFDRYQLSAFERRLVVVIGLVVFLVLNMFLVWPRFSDWGRMKAEMAQNHGKIASYDRVIARVPALKTRLETLQSVGSDVMPEARANDLMRLIQDQAAKSRLPFPNISPVRTSSERTTNNLFFDQKAYRVTVNTGDKELVDFLVALGSEDSLVRVRDLDLKPEAPQNTKLISTITLVANYQKQPLAEGGVSP